MTVAASIPRPIDLKVVRARGFVGRLRGWLGRSHVDSDEGLWLEPCHAVHGFGMRVAVDVVFLDRQGRVLRTARLAPWRWQVCAGAQVTVELAEGTVERLGVLVGRPWAWPPTMDPKFVEERSP